MVLFGYFLYKTGPKLEFSNKKISKMPPKSHSKNQKP